MSLVVAMNFLPSYGMDVQQSVQESKISQPYWDELHDGVVLDELIQRGLLTQAVTKKKAVIVTDQKMGSKTSRLLFLKTADGASYVIKENKHDKNEYSREKDIFKNNKIAQWNKIIQEYSQKHGVKLPILVDYHATFKMDIQGTPTYITMMSKAKGESLMDICERIHDQKSTMSEEEVIDLGATIGTQMGHLTRAFFLKNGTILVHADPGSNNFFYDSKNKQLYWIDLGGTREFRYVEGESTQIPPYSDDTYTSKEDYMIRPFWAFFFPLQSESLFKYPWERNSVGDKRPRLVDTEEYKAQGVESLRPLRLGILGAQSFYDAYVNQVKDLSLQPSKEWETNSDAFTKNISRQKSNFQTVANAVFEWSTGQKYPLIDYLFAPAEKAR